MADRSTEIADLEAALNAAVESVTTDGTTTRINLAAARKRLADLKADDDASIAAGTTRPRISRLKLGGCF